MPFPQAVFTGPQPGPHSHSGIVAIIAVIIDVRESLFQGAIVSAILQPKFSIFVEEHLGDKMAQDRDHAATAETIRATIADTPKKSKQILLKTLLKQYGFKTR